METIFSRVPKAEYSTSLNILVLLDMQSGRGKENFEKAKTILPKNDWLQGVSRAWTLGKILKFSHLKYHFLHSEPRIYHKI